MWFSFSSCHYFLFLIQLKIYYVVTVATVCCFWYMKKRLILSLHYILEWNDIMVHKCEWKEHINGTIHNSIMILFLQSPFFFFIVFVNYLIDLSHNCEPVSIKTKWNRLCSMSAIEWISPVLWWKRGYFNNMSQFHHQLILCDSLPFYHYWFCHHYEC